MADVAVSPSCPNSYETHGTVLCGCLGVHEDGPRHWLHAGAAFFCRCAPREHPPLGSGIVWGAEQDGFACLACSRGLPDRSSMRQLACDMWCCWCGGLAQGDHGFRIYGHPAKKDSGTGGPPLGAILEGGSQ